MHFFVSRAAILGKNLCKDNQITCKSLDPAIIVSRAERSLEHNSAMPGPSRQFTFSHWTYGHK